MSQSNNSAEKLDRGPNDASSVDRKARDGRAFAVAGLLRSGWTAKQVAASLRIIDAGGGVELAMAAMRAARENDA